MNRVLVARNHGVDWRILPRAQTFEAELIFVIRESGGNIRGEKLRRDLTDHESSLVQIHVASTAVQPFAVTQRRPAPPHSINAVSQAELPVPSLTASAIAGFARCVVLLTANGRSGNRKRRE